jgi:dipeptidyl aminopeptidase/acylaminoacyl peptidase
VTVPDVADANSAAWSPDGQKVIVSMSVSGRLPSLWTVDVDGDDLVRVAVAGNCSKTGLLLPSWSPDGKRFAYINHASDTDECRHRKPAVVVREFGSRERLALGRTLGIGMFYVPSIYEADFSADGSELLVRGAGAPVESFGARIDLSSGTITDFDEYGCIRDEDCLRAYQPTPSGGTATIISSLTSGDEPAAYVAITVAGVLIGEFIDPTVFTDGDEVGFDWYLADQIDVQPLPN